MKKRLLGALSLLLILASCAGARKDQEPEELVGSATISTKVKTKLLTDQRVNGLDVNVDSFEDTVLLTGFVRSQEEKERAALLAGQVPGVREVENELQIRGE